MPTSALEVIDDFEKVSDLFVRSYKPTEISRRLGIPLAQVKKHIADYREYISTTAHDDPDFLDRVTHNTLAVLDEVSMQSKEAWEIYETTKTYEAHTVALQALKLASELTSKKAQLLQLMGARTDSGMTAKMQRLEQVNELVTSIIREVIADCERCSRIAQDRLFEAFDLMDKPVDPQPTPISDEADLEQDISEAELDGQD